MPRDTARRRALLDAMDRDGRRLGFHSTMHNVACAGALGLHPTDWEVLDVLGFAGACSAGTLARTLGLSNAAMSGALDRLEAGGWVARRRDPEDRRRVLVDPLHERDGELGPVFQRLNAAMVEAAAPYDEAQLEVIHEFMCRAGDALAASTEALRAQRR